MESNRTEVTLLVIGVGIEVVVTIVGIVMTALATWAVAGGLLIGGGMIGWGLLGLFNLRFRWPITRSKAAGLPTSQVKDVELRAAVINQIPPGLDLLQRSRNPDKRAHKDIESAYARWVKDTVSLLEPQRRDLAANFMIANTAGPTLAAKLFVSARRHKLWDEIWKRLRVLNEIERELGAKQ